MRPPWGPLSIPDHGGRTMALGTAVNILNQLEADIDALEMELESSGAIDAEDEEEAGEGEGPG